MSLKSSFPKKFLWIGAELYGARSILFPNLGGRSLCEAHLC
jgi:hypothetical protein